MKSKYSDNLRKIRKAAGLTLKELSTLSGHSIQLLQAYETRVEPKVGTYNNLIRICKKRINKNLKIAETL
jgi:transcriptional regulator with XRE-family HTH domain